MDLLTSTQLVEALGHTLDIIGDLALAAESWRIDVARAVGALVGSSASSVVVVNRPAAVAEARLAECWPPEQRRRRANGVWARGGRTSSPGDAIGMTVRASESGVVVSVVCDFAAPRPADQVAQHLALLRVLFPTFDCAVARRFGHAVAAEGRHPLLSPSVQLLLDALPDGVACLDDDGNTLWRNSPLERLLAADSQAERLRREIATMAQALAIRAWSQRAGVEVAASPELTVGELSTHHGRYWLRLVRAEDSIAPLVLAIVTRVGMSATDDALESLRRHYRLSRREAELVRLLCEGRREEEVAAALDVSPQEARRQTEKVLEKLGVASRADVLPLLDARARGAAPRDD